MEKTKEQEKPNTAKPKEEQRKAPDQREGKESSSDEDIGGIVRPPADS